jgi:hypothetical protein
MNLFKKTLRIAALLIASATASFAANTNDYDLPAVGGYDLVSYHQDSGPVRGSGFQALQHDGITYIFATEANKMTFEANPDKYLPAYNGYCAFGVSLGKKFNSDPTVYEIVDGTVYLNIDKEIQAKWAGDMNGNITSANKLWESIN